MKTSIKICTQPESTSWNTLLINQCLSTLCQKKSHSSVTNYTAVVNSFINKHWCMKKRTALIIPVPQRDYKRPREQGMEAGDYRAAAGWIETQHFYSPASVFCVCGIKEELGVSIFRVLIWGWPQSMQASVWKINGAPQWKSGIRHIGQLLGWTVT